MRYERTRTAALLLGAGLGGFLDGILLQQIAQWHETVSARVPPVTLDAVQVNMLADGLFNLALWAVVVAGVLLLWSGVRANGPAPSTRAFCGYMIVGWGAFNLAEGALNHHVFQLHHVRDLPSHLPAYDWVFLGLAGIAFIVVGLAMRDGKYRVPANIAERRSGRERRSALAS
jgi:uncharacterized membrane protein